MKKIVLALTFLCMVMVPVYFMFFWNPYTSYEDVSAISYNVEEVSDISLGEEDIASNNKVEMNKEVSYNKVTNILRMSSNMIREKISKEDVSKINSILSKLSVIDLYRIEELRGLEDEERATEEFVNLIKLRLSNSDYYELKKVLVPYIDFSTLE